MSLIIIGPQLSNSLFNEELHGNFKINFCIFILYHIKKNIDTQYLNEVLELHSILTALSFWSVIGGLIWLWKFSKKHMVLGEETQKQLENSPYAKRII